jgi:hypothetical protein
MESLIYNIFGRKYFRFVLHQSCQFIDYFIKSSSIVTAPVWPAVVPSREHISAVKLLLPQHMIDAIMCLAHPSGQPIPGVQFRGIYSQIHAKPFGTMLARVGLKIARRFKEVR